MVDPTEVYPLYSYRERVISVTERTEILANNPRRVWWAILFVQNFPIRISTRADFVFAEGAVVNTDFQPFKMVYPLDGILASVTWYGSVQNPETEVAIATVLEATFGECR